MYLDKDPWLNNTKVISKKFIEENYPEEISLFDTFWQVFAIRINEVLESGAVEYPAFTSITNTITDISFAKENALDLLTPIVIGVITEVMFGSRAKNLSTVELKKIIGDASVRLGAKPSLTACLMREIPPLYNSLSQYKDNVSEATIRTVTPQYTIWTKGTERVVKSIDKFEKNKDKYLFWIDMQAKRNYSHIVPNKYIGQTAAKLLRCLVESLGDRVAVSDVFKQVFAGTKEDNEVTNGIETRIWRQLSNLETLSNNEFLKYLFDPRFTPQGIGLKNDFKEKYFLYQYFIPDNQG
jgi:hypothetical protein